MDDNTIHMKVKLKPLFWFKLAIIKLTSNIDWYNSWIRDIEDNPKRYYKVKITKPQQ